MTHVIITAATGFLVAVLWFDLMFDLQILPHRRSPIVPDQVLDSVSAYYRRVTTTASPMSRLVALTMLVLLIALVVQAARADAAVWVSAVSLVAAAVGIGLAAARVVGAARRLGARSDSLEARSGLARGVLRDHIVCLMAMVTLLAVQLAAG